MSVCVLVKMWGIELLWKLLGMRPRILPQLIDNIITIISSLLRHISSPLIWISIFKEVNGWWIIFGRGNSSSRLLCCEYGLLLHGWISFQNTLRVDWVFHGHEVLLAILKRLVCLYLLTKTHSTISISFNSHFPRSGLWRLEITKGFVFSLFSIPVLTLTFKLSIIFIFCQYEISLAFISIVYWALKVVLQIANSICLLHKLYVAAN